MALGYRLRERTLARSIGLLFRDVEAYGYERLEAHIDGDAKRVQAAYDRQQHTLALAARLREQLRLQRAEDGVRP